MDNEEARKALINIKKLSENYENLKKIYLREQSTTWDLYKIYPPSCNLKFKIEFGFNIINFLLNKNFKDQDSPKFTGDFIASNTVVCKFKLIRCNMALYKPIF